MFEEPGTSGIHCITVNDCTDLENVYDAVMCDHMVTSTRPNLRRQPPACRPSSWHRQSGIETTCLPCTSFIISPVACSLCKNPPLPSTNGRRQRPLCNPRCDDDGSHQCITTSPLTTTTTSTKGDNNNFNPQLNTDCGRGSYDRHDHDHPTTTLTLSL